MQEIVASCCKTHPLNLQWVRLSYTFKELRDVGDQHRIACLEFNLGLQNVNLPL